MFKKLLILTSILGIPSYHSLNAMSAPTKEIPNSGIQVEVINRTPTAIRISADNPFPWYYADSGNVTPTEISAGQTKTIQIKPIYESSLYSEQGTAVPLLNFFSIKSEDYAPDPFTGFFSGLDVRIDNSTKLARIGFLSIGTMGWEVKQQQLSTISAPPYALKARLVLDGPNLENSSVKLLTTQPAPLKDIALRSIASKITAEGVEHSKTYAEAYKRLPVETREELEATVGKVSEEEAVAAQKDIAYW